MSGEKHKQKELQQSIDKFELPRNEHLDEEDSSNHNWNHVGVFELIFNNELLDTIISMTNRFAIENYANGCVPLDRPTLKCFWAFSVSGAAPRVSGPAID